jgi:hypothetical protein
MAASGIDGCRDGRGWREQREGAEEYVERVAADAGRLS